MNPKRLSRIVLSGQRPLLVLGIVSLPPSIYHPSVRTMISKLNRLWTTLVFPHIESNHRALAACLVALFTFCGVSFFAVAKGAVAPSSVASAPYLTATVLVGNVTSSLNVTGTLQAVVTAKVGSQLSGQIEQLLVGFNDHVTKGQIMARLELTDVPVQGSCSRSNLGGCESQNSYGPSRSNQIRH